MPGGRYSCLYVANEEKYMQSWDLNLWSATAVVILHTHNCTIERDKSITLLGYREPDAFPHVSQNKEHSP